MKTNAVLFATLFTFTAAQAQTAGSWNFSGALNGSAGTGLSVSSISIGPAIGNGTFHSASEWYAENGFPSGAVDPNAYIQFTLTANSGRYLVLNSIALLMRRSTTGTTAGSGPNSWALRSSLDNYAANISTGAIVNDYATYNVTLPSAFQSIPSTVTFRLYGYNSVVTTGGSARMVFDNISVAGQANSGVLAEQSISLQAKASGGNGVDLSWDAVGFSSNTVFSVERSANGSSFTDIYRLAGISSFADVSANGAAVVYYRIAATLADGSSFYSPIIPVRLDSKGQSAIKGVSAQGSMVKTFLHLDGAGACQVSIWSQDGKPLARQTLNGMSGDVQSDIAFSYPHGVYILTLAKEGRISSKAFVY